MVIQNVCYPDDACEVGKLYFKIDGQGQIKRGSVLLQPEAVLSTDTYMNVLDLGHWSTYTDCRDIRLTLNLKGRGTVHVMHRHGKNQNELASRVYSCDDMQKLKFQIPEGLSEGLIFFLIRAERETLFSRAGYETDQPASEKICLAVDICTYHRKEQLQKNLKKFLNSLFFEEDSNLFQRLAIYVVDNGDDFDFSEKIDGLHIIKNSNRGGGSGGFTRGLEAIRENRRSEDIMALYLPDEENIDGEAVLIKSDCFNKHLKDEKTIDGETGRRQFSHTIFMDDDVEFQPESFYRLYAFLSYMKPEYRKYGVAGRMFRLDHREIQYTAAEIWNHGNLIHAGGSLDMTKAENVNEEKDLIGEYGGWWLCAYPASVSLKEKPFPFFLHCDDVEFGLRQARPILTLRGFQVWHETYEYRKSLSILYYDIRNTFVVNLLQEEITDAQRLIGEWKQRMNQYHNSGQWAEKYLCTLALWHLGRQKIFRERCGELPRAQLRFCRREHIVRRMTPVFHRITERYIKNHFDIIAGNYKKMREDLRWQ